MPSKVSQGWGVLKNKTGLRDEYLALFLVTACMALVWAVGSACLEDVSYLWGIGTLGTMGIYLGFRMYFVKILKLKPAENKSSLFGICGAVLTTVTAVFCVLGETAWSVFGILIGATTLGASFWFMLLQFEDEAVVRMINWLNEAYLKKITEEDLNRWSLHVTESVYKFEYFRNMSIWAMVGVCIVSHLVRGKFAVLPSQVWLVGCLLDYFMIGIFSGLNLKAEKSVSEPVLKKRLKIRAYVYGGYLVAVCVMFLQGSFMHGLFRYAEMDLVFLTGLVLFMLMNLVWAAFAMKVQGCDVLGGFEQHGFGVLLAAVGLLLWWVLSLVQFYPFGMVRLNWQECLVAWVFSVFFLPVGVLINTITMKAIRD